MKKKLMPLEIVLGKCNFCMDMTTEAEDVVPIVHIGYIGICKTCAAEISLMFKMLKDNKKEKK